MTEQEAKAIISSYGEPANIAEHIEAIRVALRVLDKDATTGGILKWAESKD